MHRCTFCKSLFLRVPALCLIWATNGHLFHLWAVHHSCSVYHRRFSAYIDISWSPQTIWWTFAENRCLKIFVFFWCSISSGCSYETAILYEPTEPSLYLFPFSPQIHGCSPCSSSLSQASCLPRFLWSVTCSTGFPFFLHNWLFSPRSCELHFPSVSEHKGIAFISFITAHDRLFWTAFIAVSWSNKTSNKVDIAQHFHLWFLWCCRGFWSSLVMV